MKDGNEEEDVVVYPSKMSGTTSRQPDMMKTAELSVLTVAVNMVVWTTGPKNATTDWMLWMSAYTEPIHGTQPTTSRRLYTHCHRRDFTGGPGPHFLDWKDDTPLKYIKSEILLGLHFSDQSYTTTYCYTLSYTGLWKCRTSDKAWKANVDQQLI